MASYPNLCSNKCSKNKTPEMNTTFPVSNRCQQTGYSLTAAVVLAAEKLKAQGVSIVDLGAGEPDFSTPSHIKAAAYDAIETNFTKYTTASGIAPLRAAVCASINGQFGSDYTPEQCCITLGGKQGIFNAVLALINAGDDVLIEKPRWVSFPEIVHLAEGRVVNIETEATDFHLTAKRKQRSPLSDGAFNSGSGRENDYWETDLGLVEAAVAVAAGDFKSK